MTTLSKALDANERLCQDLRARRTVRVPVIASHKGQPVLVRPIIHHDMLPHGVSMRAYRLWEMQAALPFTGVDDIINAITNGQYDDIAIFKNSAAPTTIGNTHSTFAEAGSPAAGATDSGGTQYSMGSGGSGASANAGGFKFATIAVSPQGRVGLAFMAGMGQIDTPMLCDRLCAIGPTLVTTTGSKTLTTMPALPRYTSGIGVEANAEVAVLHVTTIASLFLDSYTGSNNGAGTNATSARLTTASVAALKVGDFYLSPFPLLSPDVGVKAIASFNVNVAATGGGSVNIVLHRRLASMIFIPIAGGANSRSLLSQIPSLPQIFDNAMLYVIYQAGNVTAPALQASFAAAYK